MDLYIGEFPSPYNGVSVKNSLLYSEIFLAKGVKKLDIAECKRSPWKIPFVGIKLLIGVLFADHVLIGVGTDGRRKFIMTLRRLLRGRAGMKRTVMVSMGGRLHLVASKDRKLYKQLSQIGSILVETNGIAEGLRSSGLSNVFVIPNCRTLDGAIAPNQVGENVKFVYFSVVCAEKGMDEVISAVEEIKSGYTIDIYGEIVDRYKDTFQGFLQKHPEVHYRGVFNSASGNVYKELNQYDVMLFPSHWNGEGVPGTLVESKIAGITAIASDWNFNKEIVIDGVEGIILKDSLTDTMIHLIEHKDKLYRLKVGAFKSRIRYNIKNYERDLKHCIERN